jgi:hypothetical protein
MERVKSSAEEPGPQLRSSEILQVDCVADFDQPTYWRSAWRSSGANPITLRRIWASKDRVQGRRGGVGGPHSLLSFGHQTGAAEATVLKEARDGGVESLHRRYR